MTERMKDAQFWQQSFLASQSELELTRKAAETCLAQTTRVEVENTDLKQQVRDIEARLRRLMVLVPMDVVQEFLRQEGTEVR